MPAPLIGPPSCRGTVPGDQRVAADAGAHRSRSVAPRQLRAAVGRAGDQRVWLADHAHRIADQHIVFDQEDSDAFEGKLQLSQLRNLVSSRAAATVLAENYVGLEQV